MTYRLLVLLLVFVCGCTHTPTFSVSVRKPNDTVYIVREGEQLIVLITSESGIGSATLDLREGTWPSQAVVRLRYAPGLPFRYLESFTIRTGSETFDIEESREGSKYREVDLPMQRLGTNPRHVALQWIDAYRG